MAFYFDINFNNCIVVNFNSSYNNNCYCVVVKVISLKNN